MATYVLIPGGGGDPWEWHRLVPELEARRHDALAVRLPADDATAGWSEYADAVIDAVGDRPDLIIVAARPSMGKTAFTRLHRADRLRAAASRAARPAQRDDPGAR